MTILILKPVYIIDESFNFMFFNHFKILSDCSFWVNIYRLDLQIGIILCTSMLEVGN